MRDNQRAHEERCAGSFFEWLAQNQGTEWEFQRAEERFPELANGTRWEFVASHPDEIQEWTAIEVKCLVFPDGLRAVSDWHKLIDDVNTKLDGQLCGKYWLARLPKYTFDQKERAALLDSLVQVIQKIAGDLAAGDMREIGPEIASLFSGWPGDTRKQPTIDRA